MGVQRGYPLRYDASGSLDSFPGTWRPGRRNEADRVWLVRAGVHSEFHPVQL